MELVNQLRSLDLKKTPSISETLDWARALVELNTGQLDQKTVETTMSVLLKHETDIIRAKRTLARRGANGGSRNGEDPAPCSLSSGVPCPGRVDRGAG